MSDLDAKINEHFAGFVVRKDLVAGPFKPPFWPDNRLPRHKRPSGWRSRGNLRRLDMQQTLQNAVMSMSTPPNGMWPGHWKHAGTLHWKRWQPSNRNSDDWEPTCVRSPGSIPQF